MKKRLFVAALLLFLTACATPKTAETPAPSQPPVAIVTPTPEVKKTVLTETFRPGEDAPCGRPLFSRLPRHCEEQRDVAIRFSAFVSI